NHTRGDFSGGTGNAKTQDIDGATLGGYGTYFHNKFAIDAALKVDLFDLDQKITCPGSTSLTNYVVAINAYHRTELGQQYWFEPTVGIRYVQSDLGSGAAAL